MTTDELIDTLLKRANELAAKREDKDASLMATAAASLSNMVSIIEVLEKPIITGSFW